MPKLTYTASKFSKKWGDELSGSQSLSVTWNDLVWAAMTVGKPGVAFLFSHGWHSISDLIVRGHTVYANLYENSARIVKSSLYEGLDPTEKSGVSYFMGMLAAKVMADRLLDVPWLFHLSMANALNHNIDLIGKSEPDMIGLRRNRQWIVAEAKGRTREHSQTAMAKAKLQTRQLKSINGEIPSLRIAVQASFNPWLHWAIEDPEEFDDQARDVEFDREELLRMYYSASFLATSEGQERIIGDSKFLIKKLPDIGVTIGLKQEVRERLNNRTMFETLGREEESSVSQPYEDTEFSVFADGVAIALDERWSGDKMSQDPWLRRRG